MPDYTYGQTLMIRSSNSGFFKEEIGKFVNYICKATEMSQYGIRVFNISYKSSDVEQYDSIGYMENTELIRRGRTLIAFNSRTIMPVMDEELKRIYRLPDNFPYKRKEIDFKIDNYV
jgi:hypothetical protein